MRNFSKKNKTCNLQQLKVRANYKNNKMRYRKRRNTKLKLKSRWIC